ncbi:hypothetical protein LCGC14_3000210, partial [marine sediment metagenome]
QIFWSAKIDVALRQLCHSFGTNPPTLGLNMWEHSWLSATSCPSGRNPWVEKFALINELEDDMVTEERVRELLEATVRHNNQQFADEVNHLIRQSHIGRDKRQAESEYKLRKHEEGPHGDAGGLKRGDKVILS